MLDVIRSAAHRGGPGPLDRLPVRGVNRVEKRLVGEGRAARYAEDPKHLVRPCELAAPDVQTVRYKVGTANIDIVDWRQKQLVWEGVIEGRLTDKMMENPQAAIDAAVAEMYTKFPGRAGAGNPDRRQVRLSHPSRHA